MVGLALATATTALAIEPYIPERPPTATIRHEGSSCGAGWLDFDRDGRDDLIVATLDGRLAVWNEASTTPLYVPLPVTGKVQQVEITTQPNGEGGIGVMVSFDNPYGSDPSELTWFRLTDDAALEPVWAAEAQTFLFRLAGDLDGDGLTDVVVDNNVIRLSSDGRQVAFPLESRGRQFRETTPVGDLDLDGYDDLLVTYEEYVPDDYYGAFRGHAALFIGGPGGLAAQDAGTGLIAVAPLWEIDSDQVPGIDAFVATSVASPGDGTLVMAAVDVEVGCWGEDAWWLVFHDAGTASPVLHQVERVPFWDTSSTCNQGVTLLVDPMFPEGGTSIVWLTNGPSELVWSEWDSAARTLDVQPIARWNTLGEFDPWYTIPTPTRNPPLLVGTWTENESLPGAYHVWHWDGDPPVDDPDPDPPPVDDPEPDLPVDPEPPNSNPKIGRSCKCETPGHPVPLGGVVVGGVGLMGLALRRRPSARVQSP